MALINSDSRCSSGGICGGRRVHLRRRVRHVEVGDHAARRALLRELQALLRALEVVAGDLQFGLRAAQLDVVARHFREAAQQGAAPGLGRGFHRGLRGLHVAADLAPQVDFPGGIEPVLIDVERFELATFEAACGAARRAVGAERIGGIGELADIAGLRSRVGAVAVEVGELR